MVLAGAAIVLYISATKSYILASFALARKKAGMFIHTVDPSTSHQLGSFFAPIIALPTV